MNDIQQGVGAPLARKEDDRFMRGRGRYVADIKPAGTRDVAFLRSPLAHGRITGISIPDDIRAHVFTAEDMKDVGRSGRSRHYPVSNRPSSRPLRAIRSVMSAS